MFNPRSAAEESFKAAAAEAALFELQMRLCAGIIPKALDLKINTKLSCLKPLIFEHYRARMSESDVKLMERACYLRNKLVHCEFSTARTSLNEINPKPRDGGITQFAMEDGVSLQELVDHMNGINNSSKITQEAVSETKTTKLCDIYGWLLESFSAGEFNEATGAFREACALLERLADSVARDT